MTLDFASRCADRLVEWLRPHCERVEIAGSIRRQRPVCNDVDLVVIPKLEEEKDMFGNVCRRRNATWGEIDARATRDQWTVLRAGPDLVSVINHGVQVDFFLASPETWGTVLVCRTGSKEHNVWLAQMAQQRGGKWHPFHGLHIHRRVVGATEDAIYREIGFSRAIPPQEREAHLLPMAGLLRTTLQGGHLVGGAR